ncbi:MAG: hypothetical protein IJW51_01330 [Clostridia bacterium]|nr:hypothetical protein [Clostridia bacterium]
MKSKLSKAMILTVALLLLITPLSGCSKWRYGAKMYSSYQHDALVKPEFIEEHKIYGGQYPNPDYYGDYDTTEDETDPNNYQYISTKGFPESLTFIITDEETFESIYAEDALEVDFDKQMVILYIHRRGVGVPVYIIQKMETNDEELTIYYKKKKDYSKKRGGGYPDKRCTTVVMRKMDITSVEFVFVDD